MLYRRRGQVKLVPATALTGAAGGSFYNNADEDPTRRIHQNDSAGDDDRTRRLDQLVVNDDEEVTNRIGYGVVAAPALHWFVDVLEGDAIGPIELPDHTRHYDIGRRTSSGKQPDIALSSLSVSRDTHATLMRSTTGMTLMAAETTNGTYLGEDRVPIAADKEHALQSNDVFWLGNVKLRIRSEVDDRA